jgi:hypothetical protein
MDGLANILTWIEGEIDYHLSGYVFFQHYHAIRETLRFQAHSILNATPAPDAYAVLQHAIGTMARRLVVMYHPHLAETIDRPVTWHRPEERPHFDDRPLREVPLYENENENFYFNEEVVVEEQDDEEEEEEEQVPEGIHHPPDDDDDDDDDDNEYVLIGNDHMDSDGVQIPTVDSTSDDSSDGDTQEEDELLYIDPTTGLLYRRVVPECEDDLVPDSTTTAATTIG